MSEENDGIDDFEERTNAPKEISTDAGSVKQYSVDDQIKAREYVKKERATKGKSVWGRVGFFKIRNTD